MCFILTNHQRQFLGLDPVEENWDKVELKADSYRPKSVLFLVIMLSKNILLAQMKYIKSFNIPSQREIDNIYFQRLKEVKNKN